MMSLNTKNIILKLLENNNKFNSLKNINIKEITQNSGSDRLYYRVNTQDNKTLIAVNTKNTKEAESYIYLSDFFSEKGINIPKTYLSNEDYSTYIIEDLGNTSLFDLLINRKNEKIDTTLFELCCKSIEQLVKIQFADNNELDYSKCYPVADFNRQALMWDLNYFKYCLLKPLSINFFEPDLEDDFNLINNLVENIQHKAFMYRDFQSRNIMIHNQKPYLIDFQGGRHGPIVYDIVSFVYQAKIKLNSEDITALIEFYFNCVNEKIHYERKDFDNDILIARLIRSLQTLGAYGFRGIIEKKQHFIESLIPGIFNLNKLFKDLNSKGIIFKSLNKIVDSLLCYAEELIQYKKEIQSAKKLTIFIYSFSYLYNSIPSDNQHGGGFVFDCRGLPNPFWIDELKEFNGTQQPIINYLDIQTEVKEFIENIIALINNTINKYIDRDFKYLSISFGCTGGKHRSVYCAEKLKKLLLNLYNVDVEVVHLREKSW